MRLIVPFLVLTLGLRSSTATESLGRIATKLPLVLLLFTSESQAANVWIPDEEPPKDNEGSVKDELAEVATVFAKPENKVVQPSEAVVSEQPVPWTSLKQEWELYKKFHNDKKRQDSDEESAEEEEEEEEEEDDLPIAFYGQQNSDDDEKDFLQKEKFVRKRTKNVGNIKRGEDSESEEKEEDEQSDQVYPQLQHMDDLDDDEKKAVIDRIFSTAGQGEGQGHSPYEAIADYEDSSPSSAEQDEIAAYDIASSEDNKKGENEDEVQDDKGGKKKKKKKKGKKKKGGHDHGWKKPMIIPIDPPKKEGWGWKKNGLLEQMVKGSTWERVLDYYHYHHSNSDKGGSGWTSPEDVSTALHGTGEKLVDKLFRGSFWDRAFRTYVQYKKNNKGKPTKEFSESPLQIDW